MFCIRVMCSIVFSCGDFRVVSGMGSFEANHDVYGILCRIHAEIGTRRTFLYSLLSSCVWSCVGLAHHLLFTDSSAVSLHFTLHLQYKGDKEHFVQ